MKAVSCCWLFIVIGLVLNADVEANPRGLSRLVGQQPLLFGRRGMNPNMNSLFFGKRSSDGGITYGEIRDKCAAVLTTCQNVLQGSMDEER